ncbi:MAG: exodeoxyribonuclease III [Bacteroidia bacterium]
MPLKVLTYNVNGIRSALTKNLLGFLEREQPDVACFQELKAMPVQIDNSLFERLGYNCYWFSAEKKGYSGVGILSKQKPKHVEYGIGHELFDYEGRIIRLDFEKFSVISAYFPSGTTGPIRQDVKYVFLDFFYNYIHQLRYVIPNLIICGDYNICHEAIDIHDPKGNKDSSGFLPEERAWMSAFFKSGFVDTFRSLNPGVAHKYTWWSFRANARNNNKGWRIDYISVSEGLASKITDAQILPLDIQSDHCASYVVMDL